MRPKSPDMQRIAMTFSHEATNILGAYISHEAKNSDFFYAM